MALIKRTKKMGIAIKVVINTYIAASIPCIQGQGPFLLLGKPSIDKTMIVKLVAMALNAPLVSSDT
jgi:hypothetical protein